MNIEIVFFSAKFMNYILIENWSDLNGNQILKIKYIYLYIGI